MRLLKRIYSTAKELEDLERDSRMAKFHKSNYHDNNVHATKEEVQEHREKVKKRYRKI